MSTLHELIAQREALETQIHEAKQHGRTEAMEKVRTIMAEHALTLADFRSPTKTDAKRNGAGLPPKYRDAANGATWSGRGPQPRWFKEAIQSGKTPESLAA